MDKGTPTLVQATESDLRVTDVPGDGSCLYHAVGALIMLRDIKFVSVELLRDFNRQLRTSLAHEV